MRKKIGLLIIATNKYIDFLQPLITSADKYFNPGDVTYFIFSDKELEVSSSRNIIKTYTEHKDWPWMTLGRYEIFFKNSDIFKDMDYLFYSDADMLFCSNIGEDILSNRVATQHPAFRGSRGTPETNPLSLACVYEHEHMEYFAGGFNGGTTEEYLKMCDIISFKIREDFKKNIIAIWHDESHMNRYFIDNPPTTILNADYCTPSNQITTRTRIAALVKEHEKYRT
jgi:histo-blood group ABO system transferase